MTTLHPFEITVAGSSMRYDGPHGPAEIAYSEDARRTRVQGPHIPMRNSRTGPAHRRPAANGSHASSEA